MYYKTSQGHGLKHNPFGALIVPRPIAWISSRGLSSRDNLAPYSFFNGVSYEPPQIMFASTSGKNDREKGKDSVSNIFETNVFCVNLVSYEMRFMMNETSKAVSSDIDEFEMAGVEKVDCEEIDCPRVGNAPANLECKLVKVVELPGDNNFVVFGEVVGVHLGDEYVEDGIFDVTKFRPLARLGYADYARVDEVFQMKRPAAQE